MIPHPRAVVFDAYGTLLDVHSAVMRHAAALGDGALAFSELWRAKQLEYSWVATLTGGPRGDFLDCTRRALAFAAARHGTADAALLDALLDAYRVLSPYPEVPGMLARLRALGMPLAVLSNGSPAMLGDALGAAGLAGLLDAVLSVEAADRFKPHPSVYDLPGRRFGLAPAEMLFVSGNPWDTQAALRAGYACLRVNRTAAPDEYGLAAAGVPSLPDLSGLLA